MAQITGDQEATISAAVMTAFGNWLPAARQAVLGGSQRHGVAPDPAGVATTSTQWQTQVNMVEDDALMPVTQDAYGQADDQNNFDPTDAIMAAAIAITLIWLLSLLVEIQAKLFAIAAMGLTLPATIAAMRDLLTITNPYWQAKAAAIATTEGNRWIQAAVLSAATRVSAKDGKSRLKMWNTQGDERVRLAHEATDGQERPIALPFDVVGIPMMFPGDPVAPADLVVNCRCFVTIKEASNG